MKNYLSIMFVLCVVNLSAQNYGTMGTLPTVPPPQPPNPYQYQNNLFGQPASPYNPNPISDIQKRNEAILREAKAYMEAQVQRQITINSLLRNGFPSYALQDPTGTSHFYQAFEEIRAMLEGKVPLNLGRTIFLIENAYYGNKLDYSEYENFIKQKVQLCQRKIIEEKLDGNNNMVKNMMLFRLIADTLQFKGAGSEKTVTHLPIQYDYDDYDFKKNFDSHFITKLMRSGVGQCNSMPLYYLVLAEVMGAEAYWAKAPYHSLVKIKDENNAWYNIELTCSAILSDAHYMNHSYIKAEAIRNKLYLYPLDRKEVIVEMLATLARYYYLLYGFDNFYLQCADIVMQHSSSSNLSALILKFEYERGLILALAHLSGAKDMDMLIEKLPEANKHLEELSKINKQIDDSGYEDTPMEVYVEWLAHLAKQKEKAEQNKTILFN